MATDENVVSSPTDDNANKPRPTELKEKPKSSIKVSSSDEETKAEENKDKEQQGKEDKASEDAINELQEKLKKAEEEASAHRDEVLRARADLENTRKRMERDIENAHKYAVEKFVQELLPVIDSLEMGLAAARQEDANISSVKEGTELTLKMFADCTDKFGMKSLDPKGEKFNPEFHQAMSMQESPEHEPDTVIAVMQKGYLLNDRLVRPAMVVVAKAASGEKKEQKDEEKPDKNS